MARSTQVPTVPRNMPAFPAGLSPGTWRLGNSQDPSRAANLGDALGSQLPPLFAGPACLLPPAQG